MLNGLLKDLLAYFQNLKVLNLFNVLSEVIKLKILYLTKFLGYNLFVYGFDWSLSGLLKACVIN